MEGVVAPLASLVSLAREAIYKAKATKKKKKKKKIKKKNKKCQKWALEHWPGQLKNPAVTLEI